MTNKLFNSLLAIYNNDKNINENDISDLIDGGFITKTLKLTEAGKEVLNNHKIDNAIILCAGSCSRFVPLNIECPKALLEVNGEVLVERQIRQLHEVGITDIVLVLGYMKEKFYYLKDKFNVTIVESKEFETRNNHSSVWAARDYLKNSIISSSDLYFTQNPFQKFAYDSYYTCIYMEGKTAERGVTLDDDDKIIDTFYGDKACDVWVTFGHAFFTKRFSNKFIEILASIYNDEPTKNKFWADIQDEHLSDLYMYAKKCDKESIQEFDSLEELRVFDKSYLNNTRSIILKDIATHFKIQEQQIQNVASLKSIKPSLFSFTYNGERYVVELAPSQNKTIEINGCYYQLIRVTERYCLYAPKIDFQNNANYDSEAVLKNVYGLCKDFIDYHKRTVPLCAAENIISKFANLPLTYGFQERYIMNNAYSFSKEDNFIGCEKLFPFYLELSEVCKRIFGARFTDARPFTGMNCIDMILKTVTKTGDRLLILSSQHGGHASVKPVAERLGLVVFNAPYNLAEMDLDYEAINSFVKENNINFILLAPSDILKPFEVTKIDTTNAVLLYDCSQLMGLIAAGLVDNPLNKMNNLIMFGGTHKTLPGPASGLILTNDDYLHNMMEKTINPLYLRHSQMHQKISLLFTLIEFEKFGSDYMKKVVHCSNYLAKKLDSYGFDVVKFGECFSYTHQIFIRTTKDELNTIYDNAYKYEVTLNKKHKDLFNGYGIRLGTQEIARYNWTDQDLDRIAEILYNLAKSTPDEARITTLKQQLSKKQIHYTFSDEQIKNFLKL